MTELRQGHRFHGPDGQFYELAIDIEPGQRILPTDFIPGGGAPAPEPDGRRPDWLEAQIRALSAFSGGDLAAAMQARVKAEPVPPGPWVHPQDRGPPRELVEAMKGTVLVEAGGRWLKVHGVEDAERLRELLEAARIAGEQA